MMPEFVGTCVQLEAEDLWDYDSTAQKISYRTFRRYVPNYVMNCDVKFGLPLSRDRHISCSRGLWKGEPAVCLMHSAIHHIWRV